MLKKYGFYILNFDIDDIWSKNALFWQKKNKKEIKQEISDNRLHRVFICKHGISMKIYGWSSGQTFTLKFGSLPNENRTLISVEVSYNLLGKGAVWKFPNEIMKEWAEFMNVEHIQLQSEKTSQIFEIDQKIDSILNYSDPIDSNAKKHYCPYCGAALKETESYCGICDSGP